MQGFADGESMQRQGFDAVHRTSVAQESQSGRSGEAGHAIGDECGGGGNIVKTYQCATLLSKTQDSAGRTVKIELLQDDERQKEMF